MDMQTDRHTGRVNTVLFFHCLGYKIKGGTFTERQIGRARMRNIIKESDRDSTREKDREKIRVRKIE